MTGKSVTELVNARLQNVFPIREVEAESDKHANGKYHYFSTVSMLNLETINKHPRISDQGLRSNFYWRLATAKGETKVPPKWDKLAHANILGNWACGHELRLKESLFDSPEALQQFGEDFKERSRIVFGTVNLAIPGTRCTGASLDDAVEGMLAMIQKAQEPYWKQRSEVFSRMEASRRKKQEKRERAFARIEEENRAIEQGRKEREAAKNNGSEKPGNNGHAPGNNGHDAHPDEANGKSGVESHRTHIGDDDVVHIALDQAHVLPVEPHWIAEWRNESDLQLGESAKGAKYVHVRSTDFPDLGFDLKRSTARDSSEPLHLLSSLRSDVVFMRQNEAQIAALCSEWGFVDHPAEGNKPRTLTQPTYGLEFALTGTLGQQNDILQVAEAQYFEMVTMERLTAPPAPPGAEAKKNAAVKAKKPAHTPFKDSPDETLVIFDASTLKKFCTPSHDGRSMLDIIKATAKLPHVKVVIPDVIANWEMLGRVPQYDQHGTFTGYEQVNVQQKKPGHHLNDDARMIEHFLESASHATVTRDHRIEMEEGANKKIIIMKTPADAEIYKLIRDLAHTTHTRRDHEQALRDHVHGHSLGEKSISAIAHYADVSNPMVIVSDDMRYFNHSAPRWTKRGVPVAHCSTVSYLEAQFMSGGEQEMARALHIKPGQPQPTLAGIKQAIFAHRSQFAKSPETMGTMFPERNEAGTWRDAPEKGKGQGMHEMLAAPQLGEQLTDDRLPPHVWDDLINDRPVKPWLPQDPPDPLAKLTEGQWADALDDKPIRKRGIAPDNVNDNRGDGWSRENPPE